MVPTAASATYRVKLVVERSWTVKRGPYNNSNDDDAHGHHPTVEVPPPPSIVMSTALKVVQSRLECNFACGGRLEVDVGLGRQWQERSHNPG